MMNRVPVTIPKIGTANLGGSSLGKIDSDLYREISGSCDLGTLAWMFGRLKSVHILTQDGPSISSRLTHQESLRNNKKGDPSNQVWWSCQFQGAIPQFVDGLPVKIKGHLLPLPYGFGWLVPTHGRKWIMIVFGPYKNLTIIGLKHKRCWHDSWYNGFLPIEPNSHIVSCVVTWWCSPPSQQREW